MSLKIMLVVGIKELYFIFFESEQQIVVYSLSFCSSCTLQNYSLMFWKHHGNVDIKACVVQDCKVVLLHTFQLNCAKIG